MQYLETLNPAQKEAVLHTKGPLLIVAGAGTGKTRTLTYRILHLIKGGVDPRSILAITFTNKAASEMKERVYELLSGQEGNVPTMATFHALGVRIIRQHHQVLGLGRYFAILDSADKKSLIKQVMKKLDIDPKQREPRKIGGAISRAKGDEKTHQTYEVNKNPLTSVVKMIWPEYESLKKQEGSLDFDDLLLSSYELLRDNPAILKSYQDRWEYIHVDEYQDTNTIQYKMVKLLSEKHKNICAVGDGDQNIYSWRGADMRNILHFEKDFPGAKVILMETNYRSTQNILQAAHNIISKNTERVDKKLVTDKDEGVKIVCYEAFSAPEEAKFVAGQAAQYIAEGDAKASDIAVLFRTNFQSRLLEEAFLKHSVPYQVLGTKFFERKEIKDLMSYMKLAFNQSSLADMKRVINQPKRGIGKVSVAKIFAGDTASLPAKAAENYQKFLTLLENIGEYAEIHAPSETVKYVIEQSGLGSLLSKGTEDDLERLENMKELVTYAKKYDDLEDSYDKFFEEVALLSDQDSIGQKKGETDTVKLMTIHASKGLEFKYVFLVGMEQGLFPGQRDDAKNKYEEEEERRLCYVAVTRAKEGLHLSHAKLRTIYGQERINVPSEFIDDIGHALLENRSTFDDADLGDDDDGETTFYLDF